MASILQTIRSGGTQHPEELLHFFQNRLVITSGTFDLASNHFLVEQSDTPAMTVDVRQGYAFIRKDAIITYPAWLNTADATVAITSNSSGNSRIDSIVLYIDLGASPNAAVTNVATLVAVAGTPAGSPVAPDSTAIQAAIGASNPYIVLADVTVASGATSIVDANIADQRVDATYSDKIGGTIPVTTKGDLFGYGSAEARIPVGSNGQILLADSTDAEGIAWANPSINKLTTPVTADPVVSSTSYIDMVNETGVSSLEVAHTAKTGRVLVLLNARLYNNTNGGITYMAIQKDSDSEVAVIAGSNPGGTSGIGFPACTFYVFTGLTVGTSYTFTARVKVSTGASTLQSTERAITAIDI